MFTSKENHVSILHRFTAFPGFFFNSLHLRLSLEECSGLLEPLGPPGREPGVPEATVPRMDLSQLLTVQEAGNWAVTYAPNKAEANFPGSLSRCAPFLAGFPFLSYFLDIRCTKFWDLFLKTDRLLPKTLTHPEACALKI